MLSTEAALVCPGLDTHKSPIVFCMGRSYTHQCWMTEVDARQQTADERGDGIGPYFKSSFAALASACWVSIKRKLTCVAQTGCPAHAITSRIDVIFASGLYHIDAVCKNHCLTLLWCYLCFNKKIVRRDEDDKCMKYRSGTNAPLVIIEWLPR